MSNRSCGRGGRSLLAALGALFLAAPAIAQVTIDSFTTNQAAQSDPPGGSSSVTGGADIVGARRGWVVDNLLGAGPTSVAVSGGNLTMTVAATTPDSRGEARLSWDGDTNPLVLDPAGLGGVNLVSTNASGFRIQYVSSTVASELELTVHSSAANRSSAARRVAASAGAFEVLIPFAEFRISGGTGAVFSSVGAVELTLRAGEGSVTITHIDTTVPTIAATKVDTQILDNDSDNRADPGDRVRYTVTITNTGNQALNVDLSDTVDLNTTLVPGSTSSTPLALNDQYGWYGNVTLTVDGTPFPTLLANDQDADGDTVSVQSVANTSAAGGTVTLVNAATGEFTYAPPSGFRGVDSFAYTIVDDNSNTSSATAWIQLQGVVWFVDDSNTTPPYVGTLADPFQSLAGVNGSDPDEPGDTIFVFDDDGTPYAGGHTLENNQRLIGQGVGLTLDGNVIVAAGGTPQIANSGGAALALAADNTVRGLSFSSSTGAAIFGNGFGLLSLDTVDLSGTGRALDLANGTLAATFSTITRSGGSDGSGRGISLVSVGGALSVTATSITNPLSSGIRVQSAPAGASFAFGATTIDKSSTSSDGLVLSSNHASASVGFSSLAILNQGGGPGILAASGGTLNLGGTANTVVTAGSSAALHLTNTSLGAGATFASVSSTNSAEPGIFLDNVAGNLAINGGAITNPAGVAFDLNAGTSNVTYAGSISNTANAPLIEVTNRTGGNVTFSGNLSSTSSGNGIFVQNNSGGAAQIITFSGASKVLNTGADPAVTLDNNDVASVHFTGGGLDIDTTSGLGFSAVNGASGVSVQGTNNTITTTTGTAVQITDSTIAAAGINLTSITSTGATASPAIVLDDTGAGGFLIAGTGSAGTGGTISNKTGDAITLNNTDGPVTFQYLIVQDIGDMGGVSNTISGDDAIHGQQVDGGLVLEGVTLRRISDNAINGSLFAGGGATVWNGLTVNNSTIEDSNRFHAAGVGDANNEGMLRILGIRGTVSITNSTLQRGGELLDFFVSGGTLTLLATNSHFLYAYKEFTSGVLASVGGHCVDVTVQGAGNANVTIGDRSNSGLGNDFLNCRLGSIRVTGDAGATGNIDTVIGLNEFTVNDHSSGIGGDFDFPMGGVLVWSLGTDTATYDVVIDGNDFDEITNASGGVGQLTLSMMNGTWQVLVEDNTFDTPGNAPWFLRADSTVSARVLFRNNLGIRGAFCSPDNSANGGGCNLGAGQLCPGAAGYCGPGLRTLADLQNGANVDLTVINDVFSEHDAGFDPGETFEARVLNTGGGGTLCLDLQNNRAPDGYSIEEFAGDFNLVGSGSCGVGTPSATCATLLGNSGNRGGANVATTNPPYVNVPVGSTVDIVATPCAQPSGAIF